MSKLDLKSALIEEVLRDKKNTVSKEELEIMDEHQVKKVLDKLLVGGLR